MKKEYVMDEGRNEEIKEIADKQPFSDEREMDKKVKEAWNNYQEEQKKKEGKNKKK